MTAFDLNDPIPLGITVTNAAGTAQDGGTVVVTVTLPDGTTSTPSVTHDGTGLYSATGPSNLPGLYQVYWQVTGANASAFSDSYAIYPSGNMIVSVSEALEFLNLTTASQQQTYSERLRSFIYGLTAVVEGIVGPIFPHTVDEYLDGGSHTIELSETPIISVSLVKESAGSGFVRTLTNQPVDGATVDAYGYTVDLSTGTLIRRWSGVAVPFLPGRRNVHVTYVAGNLNPGRNVIEGALELLRINWQPALGGNRPGASGGPGPDGLAVDGAWRMGYFVPNRVMEQLAPSRHNWGIA